MKESSCVKLPQNTNIITFDLLGKKLDTGEPINTRKSGIVILTQQLVDGFVKRQPDLNLTVTRSIIFGQPEIYEAVTPNSTKVTVREIDTNLMEYIGNPLTNTADRKLIQKYWEENIGDPTNPVYKEFARQYGNLLKDTNEWTFIILNVNPLVYLLKAEELGYIDKQTVQQVNVAANILDIDGYSQRLEYIKNRLADTRMDLKIVAGSEYMKKYLIETGFPENKIYKVPYGIDVELFDSTIHRVEGEQMFEEVRRRNNLPENGKMIIVPARRVKHKGHLDVIEAVKILKDEHSLKDAFVIFTGQSMTDTKSQNFDDELRQRIEQLELTDKVFMLDALSRDELHACIANADISLLPSTENEGFGYANLEAMLAGAPVITTPLGATSEYIIPGETGLFIEPHNPQSIAKALEKLLTNESLIDKFKRNGRSMAEKFDLDSMISGYIDVINDKCIDFLNTTSSRRSYIAS